MKAKLIREDIRSTGEKRTYTEKEVIDMLEDVYCYVAASHNDYDKQYSDYEGEAVQYVKKYMETHKKHMKAPGGGTYYQDL